VVLVRRHGVLAMSHEHDPDYPDVDPATGDERETTE
jgi:hypothetical protein